MLERRQPSLFLRILSSRWFFIIGTALIVLIFLANLRVYYHGYKIRTEMRALQAEIDALSQKRLESMEILQYVMSSDFVEDAARTELNMKKPGEHVLVVQNQEPSAKAAADSAPETRQEIPNPLKWWYYFRYRGLPE